MECRYLDRHGVRAGRDCPLRSVKKYRMSLLGGIILAFILRDDIFGEICKIPSARSDILCSAAPPNVAWYRCLLIALSVALDTQIIIRWTERPLLRHTAACTRQCLHHLRRQPLSIARQCCCNPSTLVQYQAVLALLGGSVPISSFGYDPISACAVLQPGLLTTAGRW